MSDTRINKIKELVKPVLEPLGLFLVDVEIHGGKETNVTVYVDAEDRGINLDECADISQELGFLIDAHELFENKYRLNVSSPGLSRPLTDRRQYNKNQGRKTRIKYKHDNEYHKLEGTLAKVEDEEVVVETEDGDETSIPFSEVVETKIIPSI